MEVNGKVTHSLISKQCSHLVLGIDGNNNTHTITLMSLGLTIGEEGYCMNVYGLPEEAWSAELDKLQPDSGGKVRVMWKIVAYHYNAIATSDIYQANTIATCQMSTIISTMPSL